MYLWCTCGENKRGGRKWARKIKLKPRLILEIFLRSLQKS